MSSKKTTELQTLASPAGVDLIMIIDDPTGTPMNKKITLDQLLRNIPANTVIKKSLTVNSNTTLQGSNTYITSNVNITGTTKLGVTVVNSNGIFIKNTLTPANSGISVSKGKIFYDTNYLYIAIANNTIKRISLSSF